MAKSKLIEMQAQNETILTLKILSKATDKLSAEIASLVSKNKTKFKRKAVILEIENQHFQANELAVLMEILTQNQLVAIGIRSSVQELIDFADISGLAIFDKPTLTPTKPKETQQSQAQQPKHRLPKIVVGGVHTSEQALSKDSDLVLLGSVETGADVIAHGSISAYQEMNGRAFAGIDGDEKSTIFIHSFNAQLISIAGIYKKFEKPLPKLHNHSVMIDLKDDKLRFKVI